jgi:hypothetical protein
MTELLTTRLSDDIPTAIPLRVCLSRQPFSSIVTLTLENGLTEDLDADEAREWFAARGARMDGVEAALDYVWNFYHSEVVINNPKKPSVPFSKVHPRI